MLEKSLLDDLSVPTLALCVELQSLGERTRGPRSLPTQMDTRTLALDGEKAVDVQYSYFFDEETELCKETQLLT